MVGEGSQALADLDNANAVLEGVPVAEQENYAVPNEGIPVMLPAEAEADDAQAAKHQAIRSEDNEEVGVAEAQQNQAHRSVDNEEGGSAQAEQLHDNEEVGGAQDVQHQAQRAEAPASAVDLLHAYFSSDEE